MIGIKTSQEMTGTKQDKKYNKLVEDWVPNAFLCQAEQLKLGSLILCETQCFSFLVSGQLMWA